MIPALRTHVISSQFYHSLGNIKSLSHIKLAGSAVIYPNRLNLVFSLDWLNSPSDGSTWVTG